MNAAPDLPFTLPNHQAGDWSRLNQRWLVAAIARLQARLARKDATAVARPIEDCIGAQETAGFTPALLHCAAAFGLSPFEREILLLVAGVELDARLRALAQQLTGNRSVHATFGLALEHLFQPHWDALSPDAPLRHWLLIAPDGSAPLTEAALRIDETILHFIAGIAGSDPDLAGIAVPVPTTHRDASGPRALVKSVADAIGQRGRRTIACLNDETHDATLLRDAAMSVAGLAQRPALWIDAAALSAHAGWLTVLARRIDRQVALTGALPVLAVEGTQADAIAARLASHLESSLVWLGSPSAALAAQPMQRRLLRFELPRPDSRQVRKTMLMRWRAATGQAADATTRSAIAAVSAQFHLRPAIIDGMIGELGAVAPDLLPDVLWQSARRQSRGGLDALAQRLDSHTTLGDMVLPPAQIAALGDIVRQLRHRERVHQEWGFAKRQTRGLGLISLFTGESGTGKTMAAEAIANAVNLDLYRVDLASLVSKYIGETEKNLKSLFDAAEASGSVLLFDEADALFGKRSEVKDSHDRYANIEVAYLLQRIEAYRGLAILTTNMKGSLDRAFLRRIRFIVSFPFPDVVAREQIWRRQFPAAAPLGRIDFASLAKFNLPGGNIRSIALNAAFRAADNGGVIDQSALTGALRAEFSKLERQFNEAMLGDGP